MRILTATILLISMLGNTFSSHWMLLDYALNKKYITAYLCENRDKPEQQCEGRCYLCKKINRENNKDQGTPGHRAGFKFQVLSLTQTATFVFSMPCTNSSRRSDYQAGAGTSFRPSFFHPPQG